MSGPLLRCYVLDVAADRADQLAVGGVTGQLPEERAAQALALGVAHLAGDRGRGVVAPPLAALEAVRGAGGRTVARALRLAQLVVLHAGLGLARPRASRRAARGLLPQP